MNEIDRQIFRLPVSISPADQKSIVDYVQRTGFITSFVSEKKPLYPWKSFVFRSINKEAAPSALVEEFKIAERSLEFTLRHRTDLTWDWVETPVTPILKNLLESLRPYCVKLSRVQVLLQRPQVAIPPHTDKVAGQNYDGVVYSTFAGHTPEPTDIHRRNKFLTIKVPLSEESPNNGKPYFEKDGRIYIYDSGCHAFALDEINIKHGAQGVAYSRGVVLIDGEYDTDRMLADAMPMPHQEFKKTNFFRRVMTVQKPQFVPPSADTADRPDLHSIYEDYKVMRFSDPSFLGCVVRYNSDGSGFVKHEYWVSALKYEAFYRT